MSESPPPPPPPSSSSSSSTTDARAALLAKLEEQQERNRHLRARMELQEAKRAELQLHVRETVVVAEQEEEAITNNLLRRLDSLHRERTTLATQLTDEERVKQEQESKLSQLKKNRSAIEGQLRSEETVIRERLERQLRSLQSQRQFIVEKTKEEATTLKQLRDCVERLQQEACSLNPSSPLSPPPPLAPLLYSDDSELGGSKSLLTAAADGSGLAATGGSGGSTTKSPHSHSRGGVVNDPSMMHCLESEIAVVEALRDEAVQRAATNQQRVAELEQQIAAAERACEEQHALLDAVRSELSAATAAANELHANNEVIAEWMMDREMFAHTGHLRSSSVCSNASTRTVETSVSDWTDSTPHVLHRESLVKSTTQ